MCNWSVGWWNWGRCEAGLYCTLTIVNLEIQEPERELFLAIPAAVYERMTQQRIFEVVAERYDVNFLIYEPIEKKVVSWVKH